MKTNGNRHSKPGRAREAHDSPARRLGSRILATLLAALWLTPSTRALNGIEGTFEFACDAPWRIEPQVLPDGNISYGAIPIQISIHDAALAPADSRSFVRLSLPFPIQLPPELVSIGSFRSVRVRELAPSSTAPVSYSLHDLFEIEQTVGLWQPSPSAAMPAHQLCRVWAGEDPEPFRNVSATTEWHSTVWYVPTNNRPGITITLQIEVTLERDAWPDHVELSGVPVELPDPGRTITLRNYVRVHLAEQRLPRFDNRWIYGDLHYHSQGTDNEGESAYNYRGVIRAMGAMGMDFLFATEHASDSPQLIDADLDIDAIEEVGGVFTGDAHDSLEEDDAATNFNALRDMNSRRYAFCHDLIYGSEGANRQAAVQAWSGRRPQNYLSYGVVPQIFLGGEIDAIPEVNPAVIGPLPDGPNFAWLPNPMPYGNGLEFNLIALGFGGVPSNGMFPFQLFELAESGDSYLVRDFQSIDTDHFYGREHLVYFPNSSRLQAGTETTFISSGTSKFGGATRRFEGTHQGQPGLRGEIERKGVAFIAHHLNGCSKCTSGPDGVPWTQDHMLLKAFRSCGILGLQFWNENSRFESEICSHRFCRGDDSQLPERGYERAEPVPLSDDKPLPLDTVRDGFITGGPAGGLFELQPFGLPSGLWQTQSFDTEHTLHHGAYDWDLMNLRGLDLRQTSTLSWLRQGRPRRVFMAGGSDAHGDLSYRRAGYFLGATEANDTALGKPRNLVFAGQPEGVIRNDLHEQPGVATLAALRIGEGIDDFDTPIATEDVGGKVVDPVDPIDVREEFDACIDPDLEPDSAPLPSVPTTDLAFVARTHTQEQIIRQLRKGKYCVTDGPALRIAVDLNANGRIDDSDIQMGDVHEFNKMILDWPRQGSGQRVRILAECISTAEFGPVGRIDLYVGVHHPQGEDRLYAPVMHGVRDSARDRVPSAVGLDIAPSGLLLFKMSDGYWIDNRPQPLLRASPPDPMSMSFTHAFVLDLDEFPAGRGVTADRFFVRAFAETFGDGGANPNRYAFTNPIWLLRSETVAELESPSAPPLAIQASGAGLTLSWPDTGNWILQQTADLSRASWSDVAAARVVEGAEVRVTMPPAGSMMFFRLRAP